MQKTTIFYPPSNLDFEQKDQQLLQLPFYMKLHTLGYSKENACMQHMLTFLKLLTE